MRRRENDRLLTGRGSYVDDVVVPDMLTVAFARSEMARGVITRFDVSAARSAPGVAEVLTAAEINPLLVGRMAATPTLDAIAAGPERPLASGDVSYVGEPYALVVATSRALAEDAIELIELDIEPLPPIVDYETAIRARDLVHPGGTQSNLARDFVLPPDVELTEILQKAAHVVTETFRLSALGRRMQRAAGQAARCRLEAWLLLMLSSMARAAPMVVGSSSRAACLAFRLTTVDSAETLSWPVSNNR